MRNFLSEFIGTATLAAVVVGSGIMAENISLDKGLQLLINAAATAAILWILISALAPISGAHFNPVVSGIALVRGALKVKTFALFVIAQIAGALAGTLVANAMFGHALIEISSKHRDGGSLFLSEVIATAGLIFAILQLSSIDGGKGIPVGVALWIFSAYFFTSSTSFANPAIAIGRIFTESFAGIAPHSALIFIPFEVLGGVLGYGLYQGLSMKAGKK
jgi:glycerol uptake facilitator-like aquaporin